METISNLTTAASNLVFGEKTTTSTEEPVSGQTGAGTATEPFDGGNKEEQKTAEPVTSPSVMTEEPPSGKMGAGTATDPYDGGNAPEQAKASTSAPVEASTSTPAAKDDVPPAVPAQEARKPDSEPDPSYANDTAAPATGGLVSQDEVEVSTSDEPSKRHSQQITEHVGGGKHKSKSEELKESGISGVEEEGKSGTLQGSDNSKKTAPPPAGKGNQTAESSTTTSPKVSKLDKLKGKLHLGKHKE